MHSTSHLVNLGKYLLINSMSVDNYYNRAFHNRALATVLRHCSYLGVTPGCLYKWSLLNPGGPFTFDFPRFVSPAP